MKNRYIVAIGLLPPALLLCSCVICAGLAPVKDREEAQSESVNTQPTAAGTVRSAPTVAIASPTLQAERADLIAGWIANGTLLEVRPGKAYRAVYVMPKFFELSEDSRQLVLRLVWAWACEAPENPGDKAPIQLWIHEAHTNKNLGWYSVADGLRLKAPVSRETATSPWPGSRP